MNNPIFPACIGVALLFSGIPMANANTLDDNKVVRDARNNVIRSAEFGTCVHTKWEEGSDICAPEPPKMAAAPVTRTILASNEKTVYFNFNSADLTEASKQQLSGIAKTLSQAKDVKSAEIVGFADRIGTSGYNESLSARRAESVRNYLAGQGYLNTRVAEVRGLGESRPVTQCDSSLPRDEEIACLQDDRRVEVEVKYLDENRVSMAQ